MALNNHICLRILYLHVNIKITYSYIYMLSSDRTVTNVTVVSKFKKLHTQISCWQVFCLLFNLYPLYLACCTTCKRFVIMFMDEFKKMPRNEKIKLLACIHITLASVGCGAVVRHRPWGQTTLSWWYIRITQGAFI